jgi:predicted amidophosphoribosyltransferase
MSDKGFNKKKVGNEEEKILYSISKIVCFACGEQIDKKTKVCPNCKTNLT